MPGPVLGHGDPRLEAGTHRQPTSPVRLWAAAALVWAVALLILVATTPIIDVDVYWHVLVGDAVLGGAPLDQAATGWTLAPGPDTWVSSQWLAEVALALTHSWLGWTGVTLWKTLTTALVLAVLAWSVFRDGRPRAASVVTFGLVGAEVAIFAQERSQQLSFAVMPVLGVVLVRALATGRLPRWWLLLPLVALWANVHGGWVMTVVVLGLAAAGRVVDHGVADRPARAALGLALLSLLAGMLTPLGPSTVMSVWSIGNAAGGVAEWAPTRPTAPVAWPLTLLAVLLVLAWARARTRPPRSEVLVVLVLLGLSLVAFRNVVVVALVLSSLAVVTLDRWWSPDPEALAPLDARDHRAAWVLGIVAVVTAVALTVATAPLPRSAPLALFARIADMPAPVRLIADAQDGGMALAFAGGPGHVLVGLDGRSERFGRAYISEYRAMLRGEPGWQRTFTTLRPEVALLRVDDALTGLLQRELGWRIVAQDGGAVLLEPPSG